MRGRWACRPTSLRQHFKPYTRRTNRTQYRALVPVKMTAQRPPMLSSPLAPAKAAETPIPTGIRLVPFDEAFRNDPYPVLKRLRDAEPIHRDESLSRWFVTGFEDVREVLRNKDLSVNINKALPESYAGRLASNAKTSGMSITFSSILFTDDPDHRRLRSLVSKR